MNSTLYQGCVGCLPAQICLEDKMDEEQKNIEVQIKVIKIMVLQLMVMAVVPFVNLFHFDRWIIIMVAAANPVLAIIGFTIAFKRFRKRLTKL
jgi:hypothetical protein